MKLRRVFWSIIKFIFRVIGKLLLLFAWCACEFLSVVFAALARWLKGIITNTRNPKNA